VQYAQEKLNVQSATNHIKCNLENAQRNVALSTKILTEMVYANLVVCLWKVAPIVIILINVDHVYKDIS
jgi:hypothetical protein